MSDEPWATLPRIGGAPLLRRSPVVLDDLFDLPPGSSCSAAEISLRDGTLLHADWRGTGTMGFYPASTIKWLTGALAVELLDAHGLTPDDVLEVEGEAPRSFRSLLLAMLVDSDNHAFNLLHEAVGTAETNRRLRAWGCEAALVRRHFTRPHYTASRACRWFRGGAQVATWPARPEVEVPLNSDHRPPPLGSREQNWMTADDLLRIAAGTILGTPRSARAFPLLMSGLAWTNQCHVRRGLDRLTGDLPGRPAFRVWNKPGCWPPDGANAEVAYVLDVAAQRHFLLAIYIQGSEEAAAAAMTDAARQAVAHLRENHCIGWDG